ncbi:MAG: NADH-quinone oxidoreductase subunit L, partial [Halapricum sp.]
MVGIYDLVPAVAVLPLIAFVIALFAGKYMPKKGALAGITATAGSLLLSIWVALTVAAGDGGYNETLYTFV